MVPALSRLHLASRSPRRQALLRQIGIEPVLLAVEVDERPRPGEPPAAYVRRLAADKAQAGAAGLSGAEPAWVLAADTTVYAGGQILGKPASLAEAQHMWSLLPSADHQVMTGVALWHDGAVQTTVVCTRVVFTPMPLADQLRYWATGEPQDKAGGYAIQGRAALYVQRIEGSYSNVVGLPLAETAALLRAADFPLW